MVVLGRIVLEICPEGAKPRPNLGDVVPNLVELNPIWPTSIKLGRARPEFGRLRQRFGRHRPGKSTKSGSKFVDFGRHHFAETSLVELGDCRILACPVSGVPCHVACVTWLVAHVLWLASRVPYPVSPVPCPVPRVPCPMSRRPVSCVSCGLCPVFPVLWLVSYGSAL